MDLSNCRRILVVKLRHHGDVLLSSPLFTALKQAHPHLRIDALVYRETREMLSGHPAIDNLYCIDKQWKKLGWRSHLGHEWALLKQLREQRYDLLIHLTESYRGVWLKHLCRIPDAVAKSYARRRGWLWRKTFNLSYPAPLLRHTVEVHLDAARKLGIQPPPEHRRLMLEPGEEARAAVASLLAEHRLEQHSRFVAIHPTSRWMFKTWPAAKVAELIDRLAAKDISVVLTAAPDNKELAFVEAILGLSRSPVINLAGQLTLKQLAALIERASVFFGVDSVPMHMAAAVGTPLVALFGPSDERKWSPWMADADIIVSRQHPCRPCEQDGCAGSKVSDCLHRLEVAEVADAIEQKWANETP